mmetsp:Transcript_1983/g.2962  ORF Transcript_1983/g.2962 Transcript_1983/m.2962 type:complete len:274 (+) Transcript_1983:854-1675(+)
MGVAICLTLVHCSHSTRCSLTQTRINLFQLLLTLTLNWWCDAPLTIYMSCGLTTTAINLLLVLLVQTLHQTLGQQLLVQILSNKHKLIDTLLPLLPTHLRRSKVNLFMDTLKDELGTPLPMKAQQSLRTVQIRSSLLQQIHHEHVKPLRMQITTKLHTNTLHQFQIMNLLILRVLVKEIWVDLQDTIHIKRIETQNLFKRGATQLGLNNSGEFVDGGKTGFEGILFSLGDEIDFVEEDFVGEGYLLEGFVDRTVGFDFVEVLGDVFAVCEAYD